MQHELFPIDRTDVLLNPQDWHGSFNGRESSLQQLSPYLGKLKSGMAQVLINTFSKPGDTVLDPFSGSGVVPLEAALLGRKVIGNDLSPYAYTLTKAKLSAPAKEKVALERASKFLDKVEALVPTIASNEIPEWIVNFFHPETLKEVIAAFDILKEEPDAFITGCLLGILQHVRPGFLSYPASHLVPYLRTSKFPPAEFPAMYEYRDMRTRLLAKIKRAYRRSLLPENWNERDFTVLQENSMNLSVASGSVDSIISSPPYFGALDYARDNRLRLWLLGCKDWKKLDSDLTASNKVYLEQMKGCLLEMNRVLKSEANCILVLGDVEKAGKLKRTAEIIGELSAEATDGQLATVEIVDDTIPDERRARRNTATTKFERILIMKKL